MSRQAFHQKLNRSLKREQEEQQIVLFISQIRADHPTLCCRYMYFMIKPDCLGRDAFEDLCRRYGFMSRRKINYHRTTYSIAEGRFDNLIEDLTLTGIDQVWSSDLTYYRIKETFFYITFIMDNYSRRILGYVVSNRMHTEQTTLPALKQAIRNRNHQIREGIIFHSDGGGQYYDTDFLDVTEKYKMKNSMCEMAWENGKAERINGVIKNNYLVHWKAENEQMLRENVDKAVNLYNTQKPHSSLAKKTPIGFENELVLQQLRMLEISEISDVVNELSESSRPSKSQKARSKNPDVFSPK
jgi:transposase InsO family protein